MPTGQTGAWTFAGSGLGLNLIDITPPNEAITKIPLPHLGLAEGSYIPYERGELIDGGEYELTFADDNDFHIVDENYGTSAGTIKKFIGLAQAMVWTKPDSGVLTNGAVRSFSGFVMEVQESQQVTGSRSTIKVKVCVAGNVTKTPGS